MGTDTVVVTALSVKIVDLQIQVRALEEILIDKGIATTKEIQEKVKLVETRDADKLKFDILDFVETAANLDKEMGE